jgi:HEPN domain-containing protein
MTTHNKKRKHLEPPAEAFLNLARHYHVAANTLFSLVTDKTSPVYFLYTHTIELAFKAYLRSLGYSAPRTHALDRLLEKCHAKGLRRDRDLANVVRLLQSENEVHGFRYFAFISTGIPDLSYLRQIVSDLMLTVTEKVEQTPRGASAGGAVLKFVVGRPVRKVPSNTRTAQVRQP